jgi:glycerophosphoryl diester phosphodiesterase
MGISDLYPINSLESIANCISLNAAGSEMDVQMTKDSVLVAYHDHDLSVSTDISGVIHSMTWEEVQNANYVNGPFSSYSITTLENIFTSLANYQSKIFTFDVKIYPGNADLAGYYETYSNVIIDFFNTYGLEDNVYIESQSPDFLNLIQSKKPNYRLYYYPQTFDDALTVALDNGFQGISISSKAISSDQVAIAHEHGLFVTVWGVKTKDENKDAIRKNPDMIQTDNVKYLVDLLN